jgi:TPR repeat protein
MTVKKRIMKRKVKIFVSYSHRNERWVKTEEEQDNGDAFISWLREQFNGDNVEFWTDHTLKEKHVGSVFSKAINENIQDSDIALLLLSQEFISSNYIMNKELPFIKEAFEDGQIKIIPVLIEDIAASFKNGWLFDLQIVPDSDKPLLAYTASKKAWTEIRTKILDIISNEVLKIRYPKSTEEGINELYNKANELALYEKRKYSSVVELYRKAAERGHLQAKEKLISIQNTISEELISIQNMLKGIEEFDKANALYRKKEYRAAVELYKNAALSGNSEAQNLLGNLYYRGENVPLNKRMAAEYYQKAVEQGNPNAQFALGNMYLFGEGSCIEKNRQKAIECYTLAAEQGHKEAESKLNAMQNERKK